MYPTIRDTLESSARKYPDRDALIYPRRNQRWTFQELDAKANRFANILTDRGVTKGDRVATLLHNGTEIALTLYACSKIGAVFTPLNYRLPRDQVVDILDDVGATTLLFEAATETAVTDSMGRFDSIDQFLYIDEDPPTYANDFYEVLPTATATVPSTTVTREDVYGILLTSGTTGRPKGVVHTHGNVMEHTLIYTAEIPLQRGDIGMIAFPMFHASELHGAVIPRVQHGVPTVIQHDFDPSRLLRAIEGWDISVMFAPPTGWQALVRTAKEVDADTSSFRLGYYASAPMPPEVLDQCLETFDADFFQAYGMTEIGPMGTILYPDEQRTKQGSAGRPVLNHELRIIEPDGHPTDSMPHGEVGEIIIAGPCTMKEYWERPKDTATVIRRADGKEWYYSRDLGYLDEDRYLHVVGRTDDLIISGGENVYPTIIEDVLTAHKSVEEVAVVGEPHDRWGEQVVAYVVGAQCAEELDRHMKESNQIADFKRPRKYYFVDEFPKNETGKVKRSELRDREVSEDVEEDRP